MQKKIFTGFKTNMLNGISLYNTTAKIQENTLLNRGIMAVGGLNVPQLMMSNNKDEAIERSVMQVLYFSMSFLSPFILLPFFNKKALKSTGIVKNFNNSEKRILEVSKKYLTGTAEEMVSGIRKTANELSNKDKNISSDFENILNRFNNKEELRQKLIKAHEKVFRNDYLTTTAMWGLAPWVGTETTEKRTHRKGFSAAYKLRDDIVDEKGYQNSKRKKFCATILLSALPAIICPKLIMKGIKSGKLKNHAELFDYTNAMFMSKTIFAMMWLLSDYPNQLIQSRDKDELKDRTIRIGAMIVMFFGGDFVLNNIIGKISDKIFKTKIVDGFSLKSFKDIEKLEGNTLKKSKRAGVMVYWTSLLANCMILGFGVPAILNRMLKKNIQKENNFKQTQPHINTPNVFKEFKIKPQISK